jgi:transcription antitermination factor NusG
LEAFLPTRKVTRRWSDRVKVRDDAVFPGYLFCRLSEPDRLTVLQSPGVLQIVGNGPTPIPVAVSEIESIRVLVAAKANLTPWPYLTEGQAVRIEVGPLAGVEGLVVRSEHGNPRVVVSVTLLQRSVATEVERGWLRVGG